MARKRPLSYSIDDLVNEYNEELYTEVAAQVEIELRKDTTKGWSSTIKNGTAIITYQYSDSPDVLFALELLRIKYELKGLVPPEYIDNENVAEILPGVFRLLCEHKYYGEFIEMGFSDEEFHDDFDLSKAQKLAQKSINGLKKISANDVNPFPILLFPFLMLSLTRDKTSARYMSELKSLGHAQFFKDMDQVLKDWRDSDTLDCSLTLARIFKACNLPNIGFCLSGKREDLIFARDV
ncbi:MAG: hypothetical protein H6581_26720 [Bacteroidia bacterium]|nr:hypothetical protein [Bacteroidia bacterium]